jgi:hypothetical protein
MSGEKNYLQGAERPWSPPEHRDREDKVLRGALPELVFTLRTPSERDRRRMFAEKSKYGGDDEGFYLWAEIIAKRHVMHVPEHVHRQRRITTIEDFIEYGDSVILAQLAEELSAETSLSEDARKNSGAPSGSSSPASSTAQPGTAGDAAPKDATGSAGAGAGL